MGIASFLGGRKAAGGGGSSADDPLGFKAQAYATTTASLPPVLGEDASLCRPSSRTLFLNPHPEP